MNIPTPETDAFVASPSALSDTECYAFARKLERERDEARQAITLASDKLMIAISDRDAWKAKATRTCHIIHSISRFGFDFHVYDCGGQTPVGVIPKFCPGCGGEIKQ